MGAESAGGVRGSITTKILVVLAGLSVLALLLFSAVAFFELLELSQFTVHSNRHLGAEAVADSKKALTDQAEQYMAKASQDLAAYSDGVFERARIGVATVAGVATEIWRHPGRDRPRFSRSSPDPPEDPKSVSYYQIVPGVEPSTAHRDLALSSLLDELFASLLANEPNLDAVCLSTESGLLRGHPWRKLPREFDARERDWYKAAVSTDGAIWSDPYFSATSGELIVTCAQAFFSAPGTLVGVISVDVTLDAFNRRIRDTHIGAEGYVFLLDDRGQVVCRPGLQATGQTWTSTPQFKNLLTGQDRDLQDIARAMIDNQSGIRRCTTDPHGLPGGEKYIAYSPIASTSWSLGVVMAADEITAPAKVTSDRIGQAVTTSHELIGERIRHTFLLLGAVFVALLLTVLLAARALSRRITQPLLTLSAGVRAVGGGDLEHRIDITTGDEIQELATSVNQMTADLKAYVHDIAAATAATERIESELNIAREIQASMLPRVFPPFPDRSELDIYATMVPAREVAGDFYDFFFVSRDQLCLTIGDVSGKGVPAALFMAITRALLRNEAQRSHDPAEILGRVNDAIAPDNENCMFASVFLAMLDLRTGELRFANGGHNPPLIGSPSTPFSYLELQPGVVVGALPGTAYTGQRLTLAPGQSLFLYTDGVTEAMTAQEEMFSEARLQQCLDEHAGEDATGLSGRVGDAVAAFTAQAPQFDDITMLALRYLGPPPSASGAAPDSSKLFTFRT